MRSRILQEGTVGLLILGGLGLFGLLIAWVQGVGLGQERYRITVEFSDAQGVQIGSVVQYRGVEIGKVTAIRPTSQFVEIEAEIQQPDLRIPSDSVVSPQSVALLGEVILDLQPQSTLPEDQALPRPVDPACNPEVILCDGSELQGVVTPDLADLITASYRLSELFSDPLLVAALEEAAKNAGQATSGLSGLTENVSTLASSLNNEMDNLSNTITTMGDAATEIQATAISARSILETNRAAIDLTLLNFSRASQDLIVLFDDLNPLVQEVAAGELLENLETLSKNLRVASSQLRVAMAALNDPSNVQVLQETLDSARITFQNAQKITTDLDELTGDPLLRGDVRRIIDGLGNLFTAAQQLEQQMKVAQDTSVAIGGPPLYGSVPLGTTNWQAWNQARTRSNALQVANESDDPWFEYFDPSVSNKDAEADAAGGTSQKPQNPSDPDVEF